MKQVLIAAFLIISPVVQAQNWEWVSNQVNVESNADPNKALVYDLWKSFLEAHDDSNTFFPQWNEADKHKWKQPDLISSEGFLNTNLYAYLNKVLEIRPENGTYVIRSMFYTPYNDNKAVFVLAITNHYTRNWPRETVGLIDYYYYPEFHFNK